MPRQSNDRRYTFITLLQLTAHAMVDELVARLTAAGYQDIRPAEHQVFENLDRGGTRTTELAARAQMTHQSMSELVAALEGRGYVERQPDPTDRRARLVQLTPKGRQMLRRALKEIAEIEAAWLNRMGRGPGQDVCSALEQGLRAVQRLPELLGETTPR